MCLNLFRNIGRREKRHLYISCKPLVKRARMVGCPSMQPVGSVAISMRGDADDLAAACMCWHIWQEGRP